MSAVEQWYRNGHTCFLKTGPAFMPNDKEITSPSFHPVKSSLKKKKKGKYVPSHRNTTGSLGEQEMLWEHKLTGKYFHSFFRFFQTHAIINSSLNIIHDVLSWTSNDHSGHSSLLTLWKQVSRDCQDLEFYLVVLLTAILTHLSSKDEIRQF